MVELILDAVCFELFVGVWFMAGCCLFVFSVLCVCIV